MANDARSDCGFASRALPHLKPFNHLWNSAGWSLDFTLALTFITLVFSAVKDRAGVCWALSAGLVAVLAYRLPNKLGLALAAFIGIAVGLLAERRPRCT